MKIIGLTGGSGSGKGEVGSILRDLGCFVVDTDLLYHDMISSDSECSRAVIARFGPSVKNENGGVDRRALADIVFSDRDALADLNRIAHSYVREECNSIIDSQRIRGTRFFVIDAPQLFEAGMEDICDVTVAVTADEDIRIRRICNRDHIDRDRAIARIRAQFTDEYFKSKCSHVIVNNSDRDRLLLCVSSFLDEIKDI